MVTSSHKRILIHINDPIGVGFVGYKLIVYSSARDTRSATTPFRVVPRVHNCAPEYETRDPGPGLPKCVLVLFNDYHIIMRKTTAVASRAQRKQMTYYCVCVCVCVFIIINGRARYIALAKRVRVRLWKSAGHFISPDCAAAHHNEQSH